MAIPTGWAKNTIGNVDYYDAPIFGYTRPDRFGLTQLGAAGNLLIRTNPSNGNYQVYERQVTGDKLIYTYNASTNKNVINPDQKRVYQGYFTGSNQSQLTKLSRVVRSATYTISKTIGGPSFKTVQTLPGYTSFTPAVVDDGGAPQTNPGADPPPSGIDPENREGAIVAARIDNKTIVTELGENRDKFDDESRDAELEALKGPKVYRYPLANLEVASEIGINFDFLRIRTVDHISSLQGNLTGTKTQSALSNTGTTIGDVNNIIRPTAGGESLAEAYFQSQRVKEYIILPMQPNISSSNAVDWGSDSMNIAKLVGGQMLNNYFNNTAQKGFVDAFKELLVNVIQQGGNLADMAVSNKSSIAALLAGSLVNGNLLQRATGTVINPNMEMLFNGPRLRTFNFQFDFTPRFKKEAEEVRAIIATLKYRMSPRRTEGNAFLRSPHIFLLDYVYNGGGSTDEFTTGLRSDEVTNGEFKKFTMNPHPYLNKIKPCALVDFNVNYTPDGSYMTYKDGGSMTRYSINMSFAEIEPIYANDYETSTYKGQFSGKQRKAFNTKEMGY